MKNKLIVLSTALVVFSCINNTKEDFYKEKISNSAEEKKLTKGKKRKEEENNKEKREKEEKKIEEVPKINVKLEVPSFLYGTEFKYSEVEDSIKELYLENYRDIYKKFTGKDLELLSKEKWSLQDIQETLNFHSKFYEKSCEHSEDEIPGFNLDNNLVFMLHLYSHLDLSKSTTGKGSEENFKERTYMDTIKKWNQVGVVPHICVWEKNLIKKCEECKYEVVSVKEVLKTMKPNMGMVHLYEDITSYSFSEYVIEIVKKTWTKYEELLKEEKTDRMNRHIRYATVNFLRVFMMEYFIRGKAKINEIVAYVDWVVSPTANLGSLPGENIIYGARVYTGLIQNGGNNVENTAFYYKNVKEENIFSDCSYTKLFYLAAVRIIKYLISEEECDRREYTFTREIMFKDLERGHSLELYCGWVFHENTLCDKLLSGLGLNNSLRHMRDNESIIHGLFLNFLRLYGKPKSIETSITRRSGHA